ncbi:DNA integrity scanning protein DisA nucleotide-binding domain protein [Candidatus Pacearchaeota archaeon]|nr:DNA integrity scanning protein DisA nucleotide-binding domain protein [Candidatus Pacearchaeota archaeon]
MKKKEVYKKVLVIAKQIARKKEGALFLIVPEKKLKNAYDLLYPDIVKDYQLDEKGIDAVIEKLATLDGAVIISDTGKLIAYGAKLRKSKAVKGYGTKHAAASGTTAFIKNSTAIVVSEEVNWIRIFQKGNIILEMDSSENPRPVEDKVAAYLSTGDKALLAAAGISVAAIGSVMIAPIMIIGGTYLAIKTAAGLIKKKVRK